MASFVQGHGFRMCGAVVRRHVVASRKVAFLTIDVMHSRGSTKFDLRAFDRGIIDDIESLGGGQVVEVTGGIDVEALKTKAGEEVKIDGYKKFIPVLTVRALHIDGSSQRAGEGSGSAGAPSGGGGGPSPMDDDLPF